VLRLIDRLASGAENVRVKKIKDGRLQAAYGVPAVYAARATQRGRLLYTTDGDGLTILGFRDRGDKQAYRYE
jgi:hypothetical protein